MRETRAKRLEEKKVRMLALHALFPDVEATQWANWKKNLGKYHTGTWTLAYAETKVLELRDGIKAPKWKADKDTPKKPSTKSLKVRLVKVKLPRGRPPNRQEEASEEI